MKASTLLFALCLLITAAGYAQQTTVKVEIKGQVTDSLTNESIPYATIRITDKGTPPLLLKAVAADDKGKFSVVIDKAGDYQLSIQYVGKIVSSTPFTVGDVKVVDMGIIAISAESNSLSAVEVVADKPLVKVDLDKITYSMEDDPEAKTNTVLEMLKKVPMITVDGEENIQLKGSSSFKIYLNGKPSNMISSNPKDVLKSMPASTIKDIEVITDPGAKYDAEGMAGIINIITQKNTSMGGYTSTLNAGVDSQGGYRGGIYLMLKSGKIGFTGNYNYGKYKIPEGSYYSYRDNYNMNLAGEGKYLVQNGVNKYNGNHQYGSGELSFEIDTLNLVNVGFNRWGGGGTSRSTSKETMSDRFFQPVYEFDRISRSESDYGSTEVNVDYQRTFSVKDRLLTASYRFGRNPSNSESDTDFDLSLGIPPYPLYNNFQYSDARMDEHTFQVDYTTPFGKIHNLETGLKYILRINESESGYRFLNASNIWEDKTNPMYEFEHNQDIVAAYGGYSLKLDKWAVKTGVRYEGTWLEAKFPLYESGNFKANYSNLVPSATVTYRLRPAQNLRLGYNMRIMRPGIWQLNPYEDTSNPSYTRRGNPNLDAVKSNSFSVNYNFFNPKINFNINTSYTFTNNSIENVIVINNDGVSKSTYDNVGKNRRFYVGGYLNWSPTPKLRIYSNTSVTYIDVRADNYGQTGQDVSNHGFTYNVSGGVQYTMPWKLYLNGNAGYFSPYISLMGKGSAFNYNSISVRRPFVKDRLNVSVYVSNPFKKEDVYKEERDVANQFFFRSENRMPRRQVGLSVSFRFGELKAQMKKVQRGISNDDSMGSGQSSGGQSGGGSGSGQ